MTVIREGRLLLFVTFACTSREIEDKIVSLKCVVLDWLRVNKMAAQSVKREEAPIPALSPNLLGFKKLTLAYAYILY